MSLRVLFAVLGIVFGIVWAEIGIGWAVVMLCCALVGYYVGAVLESGVAITALLDPLRKAR